MLQKCTIILYKRLKRIPGPCIIDVHCWTIALIYERLRAGTSLDNMYIERTEHWKELTSCSSINNHTYIGYGDCNAICNACVQIEYTLEDTGECTATVSIRRFAGHFSGHEQGRRGRRQGRTVRNTSKEDRLGSPNVNELNYTSERHGKLQVNGRLSSTLGGGHRALPKWSGRPDGSYRPLEIQCLYQPCSGSYDRHWIMTLIRPLMGQLRAFKVRIRYPRLNFLLLIFLL
jgi:hypothetical protein